MRTIYRNQAEIEAKELAQREELVTTVYKLADGRYEVERGFCADRGGSAVARFGPGGVQQF